MAYEKIGFSSGQILTADNMNHIEEGIVDSVQINQGSFHAGKILVVGADGNLTLTEMPSLISGDVIGTLDANNNIVITGELADGTYTFRYENTDGTYADIGSLTVGNGGTEVTYTNLADTSAEAGWLNDKRFSTSNLSTETIKDQTGAIITNYIQINIGQTLRIKGIDCVNTTGSIVPVMARYNPKDTFITLRQLGSLGTYDAATNISEFTFSNSVILDGDYIRMCGALVDGYTADDVIITLDEEIPEDNTGSGDENTPTYTNIIDTVGYKNDIRVSTSDGGDRTGATGYTSTGIIDLTPYAKPRVLRTKGVDFRHSAYSQCAIAFFSDANGTFSKGYSLASGGGIIGSGDSTMDAEGNMTLSGGNFAGYDYVRFCGYGDGANLIVTVNEEIPD